MPASTGRRSLHSFRFARTYRDILALSGARAFFLAGIPGRIGIAMTGLGLVFLLRWGTGSFAVGGQVVAAFAVAEAVAGPQLSRLMDRYGQPRVLPPTLLAHGVSVGALVAIVLAGGPTWAMIALGALIGATLPQLGACTVVRWSHLLADDPRLRSALALDSSTNNVAFLLGPTLVGTVSTLLPPATGSLLAGGCVLGGGLALAALRATAPPPVAPAAESAGRRTTGGLLRRGFVVLVVLQVVIGLYFGAMGVSVTAYAFDHGIPGAAGPLNSVGSCAGLVAGLLFGLRTWRMPPGTQLVGVLLLRVGCCAPLLLIPGPWPLAVVLAAAGFALAPTLVLLSTLTQSLVDKAKLTQAFSWGNSSSAAGIALASSFSGAAIDAAGARAGFAVAVGSAVLAAALAVAFRRALTPAGSPGEGPPASGSATARRP